MKASARAEDVAAFRQEAEEAPAAPAVALDEILPTPAFSVEATPAVRPAALGQSADRGQAAGGMRTARVTSLTGRHATITMRGQREPAAASVAPEVDPAVVADALESGESVLVELCEGELPLIVAALHTRRPREIRLKASIIQIEGEEEVLLRSGRGAVRIRADGDIEVVGSRISAASRGLFRIVGRMLRLN